MPNPTEVELHRLTLKDAEVFLLAARRSDSLHHPWISAPSTRSDFEAYVVGANQECFRFGVWLHTGGLVGVVNINAIIRGAFQNGSLGFYAFEGYQRRGLMSAGLRRVIDFAFMEAGLHRLEANIQPDNEVSRQLIARLGFRSEGVACRLLKVNGEWRDHERFALTVEEWKTVSFPQ
jgi:ribosomal-protein-alanine N-acetyltransferase